jgi:NAD(P)H-dependent FMN reductase
MQLRMTLAELGMSSVPSLMPIPSIARALGEDGTPAEPRLTASMARFLDEFEWYARAMQAEREKGVPR